MQFDSKHGFIIAACLGFLFGWVALSTLFGSTTTLLAPGDPWVVFPHESGTATYYVRPHVVHAFVEWDEDTADQLGYRTELYLPGTPTIRSKLDRKEILKRLIHIEIQ